MELHRTDEPQVQLACESLTVAVAILSYARAALSSIPVFITHVMRFQSHVEDLVYYI